MTSVTFNKLDAAIRRFEDGYYRAGSVCWDIANVEEFVELAFDDGEITLSQFESLLERTTALWKEFLK
jgi:hypothetical protein